MIGCSVLAAYVDGELDAEQQVALEQALSADAALRARVDALQAQRERVADAFAPLLDEVGPDRLSRLLADDEHHLAIFDLSNREPGRLVTIFDGKLPLRHKARKAAKPDCEALLVLPAFAGFPHGALMAMGSGSRPSRQRGALLPLDAAGEIQGPARTVDLAPRC